MIFGCGIDIEEPERFNKHYFTDGRLSDLVYDIFSTREIENYSVFGKEAFLKGFSFKEAFYKAMDNTEIGFKDIEIFFNTDGSTQFKPSIKVKDLFAHHSIGEVRIDFKEKEQYVISKVILIQDNE